MRIDVVEFLDRVPDISKADNQWFVYGEYKRELWCMCGPDAAPDSYDLELFDVAQAEMVRRMGL